MPLFAFESGMYTSYASSFQKKLRCLLQFSTLFMLKYILYHACYILLLFILIHCSLLLPLTMLFYCVWSLFSGVVLGNFSGLGITLLRRGRGRWLLYLVSYSHACANPESFVRVGPTQLWKRFFAVDKGERGPNYHWKWGAFKWPPLSWGADDSPTLIAGLVVLWFFRGSTPPALPPPTLWIWTCCMWSTSLPHVGMVCASDISRSCSLLTHEENKSETTMMIFQTFNRPITHSPMGH